MHLQLATPCITCFKKYKKTNVACRIVLVVVVAGLFPRQGPRFLLLYLIFAKFSQSLMFHILRE